MKFRILKHLRQDHFPHTLYTTRLLSVRKWTSKAKYRIQYREFGKTGSEFVERWKSIRYVNVKNDIEKLATELVQQSIPDVEIILPDIQDWKYIPSCGSWNNGICDGTGKKCDPNCIAYLHHDENRGVCQ